MFVLPNRNRGLAVLDEMREFASFPKWTQRYIRRSLDVGLRRHDAIRRWSRDALESESIGEQQLLYSRLDEIRSLIPDDHAIEPMAQLMSPLVALSAFDLSAAPLTGFASYRFLYERLIGAAVRPWLPAAFCAAAGLPHLSPLHRRKLFESLAEPAMTAPGWSQREPAFFPEWVEKVDATIAA